MEPRGAANRFLAPEGDEFVFWEVGSLLASKEGLAASLPESAWLCAVDPAPVLGLHLVSPAKTMLWGPFLSPGLPACLLASFASNHLVNCPAVQLTY